MSYGFDVLTTNIRKGGVRQTVSAARSFITIAVLLASIGALGFTQSTSAAVQSFEAVADAQLSTQSPATANGTDVKMATCGNGTPVCAVDGVNEKRAIVKFNVSGLTTAVTNARLRFYVSTKPVPAMQIRQMTSTSWTESNATWNSVASSPLTTATFATSSGSAIGWYEVDVTAAVTGNNTVSFMIMNPSDVTTRIATRETTTKPQLIVTTQDQLPPPPVDACPDLAGDQPEGTDCTPPVTDACPDLAGDQPAGTDCTPPIVDVCPNIEGNQPEGTTCTTPTPVDACPDLAGDQPEGTDCTPTVVDACPDLSGDQPAGTDCTPPPVDACPNIEGNQAEGTNCTPPQVELPMRIFFGTTHAHTGLNNDHGTDTSTAAQNFATAKQYGFNFLFLTEHSGPTGPANGAAYYADAKAQADYYTETDKFVGLAGYEYSENTKDGDNDTGHMTGWGTDEFINAAAPGINFNAFYEKLVAERASKPVIAGYNHPDLGTGHSASAPAFLTPARRELLVMSETTHKMEFITAEEAAFYNSYIVELDRGWRVAPTCGLDSHGLYGLQQVESSTKKPCRTGVLATTLTKNTLVEAFQQRRIYASRDSNLALTYKVNGAWMGSIVGKPVTASFDITVSDPNTTSASDKITKIDIIGSGGAVLASQTFSGYSANWQPTVNVGTNKYMFARVFTAERSTHTAIGAPVWFE